MFVFKLGLNPSIDNMSAMKMIDNIKENAGIITSFKSHCGGLVAPESDDNPWHYKISWNPRNVVNAGKAGATYKLDNAIQHKEYNQIFGSCIEINISPNEKLAYYRNRDSLNYLPDYASDDSTTFLQTR